MRGRFCVRAERTRVSGWRPAAKRDEEARPYGFAVTGRFAAYQPDNRWASSPVQADTAGCYSYRGAYRCGLGLAVMSMVL